MVKIIANKLNWNYHINHSYITDQQSLKLYNSQELNPLGENFIILKLKKCA